MNEENRYRQLLALVLLSAARGAVEYITNPESRDDAGNQMREAFANIDYDAAAQALVKAIDNVAEGSKGRLNETIDQLRDVSKDKVDVAKERAQKQLAPQKKSRKAPLFIALVLSAIAAYFVADEQRRDDLLDRLTGASGPIEQSSQDMYSPPSGTAQSADQTSNEGGSQA